MVRDDFLLPLGTSGPLRISWELLLWFKPPIGTCCLSVEGPPVLSLLSLVPQVRKLTVHSYRPNSIRPVPLGSLASIPVGLKSKCLPSALVVQRLIIFHGSRFPLEAFFPGTLKRWLKAELCLSSFMPDGGEPGWGRDPDPAARWLWRGQRPHLISCLKLSAENNSQNNVLKYLKYKGNQIQLSTYIFKLCYSNMCVYSLIRSGDKSPYYCHFSTLMGVNNILTSLQQLLCDMKISVVSFGGKVTGAANITVACPE